MSALVRLQFKEKPSPQFLAELAALISTQAGFEDWDILEDRDPERERNLPASPAVRGEDGGDD